MEFISSVNRPIIKKKKLYILLILQYFIKFVTWKNDSYSEFPKIWKEKILSCVQISPRRNERNHGIGHLGKLVFMLQNHNCRAKRTLADQYAEIFYYSGNKIEITEVLLLKNQTLTIVVHLLVTNKVCMISFCFRILHLLKSRILRSQSVPNYRGVSSH